MRVAAQVPAEAPNLLAPIWEWLKGLEEKHGLRFKTVITPPPPKLERGPLPAARQPQGYAVGMEVEVLYDKGLDGHDVPDALPAVIHEICDNQTRTVIFEDERFAGLRKVWATKDICRKPPKTPAGFAEKLVPNDTVQYYAAGGWWDVSIVGVADDQLQAARASNLNPNPSPHTSNSPHVPHPKRRVSCPSALPRCRLNCS
jgi:hypothetical protein